MSVEYKFGQFEFTRPVSHQRIEFFSRKNWRRRYFYAADEGRPGKDKNNSYVEIREGGKEEAEDQELVHKTRDEWIYLPKEKINEEENPHYPLPRKGMEQSPMEKYVELKRATTITTINCSGNSKGNVDN